MTSKIILLSTLVSGIMFSLFAYIIYRSAESSELATLDARLESHADKLMTELEEDADAKSFPDKAELSALRTEGLVGVRYRVLGKSGEPVVADSLLAEIASPDLQQVFEGISIREARRFPQGNMRCLWIRAEVKNRYPYVVEVAAPMTDLEATLARLRLLFLFIIPVALVATSLAALGITRAAFRPLRGMVETAREITAENLHRRLTLPDARDEVRLLGETLNNMIDRLGTSFESQRQFIADASHELRTPLTVVCTELEFVSERLSDPALTESIQVSLAEIDRLAKLADGLLLLAKLDASQLKLDLTPVRLDELLLECIQRVRTLAERKKIEMRVEVQEPVELKGDREKLKSIFLNLLDNAVKYSPEEGVISARLGVVPANDEPGEVIITISDNGPGIPRSEFVNIFLRFYRIDPSRNDTPGSGLGLAIVEQLVKLHGGSVDVESEPEKGAAFTVKLPLK